MALTNRIAIQVFHCLVCLKQNDIIHCDIKPENILLEHPFSSKIKVIDYGSGCLVDQKVYTYIQSRFYRSPEIIIGMDYTPSIDVWSTGCVLAELFTGTPLFPGENEQDQMACIMEVLGYPSDDLIFKGSRSVVFFDSNGKQRNNKSSRGKVRLPGSKPLNQVIKGSDSAFLDFLTRCLTWEPDRRITPEEAFSHPFFTGELHDMADSKTVASNSTTNQTLHPGISKLPAFVNGSRNKEPVSLLPNTSSSSYRRQRNFSTGTYHFLSHKPAWLGSSTDKKKSSKNVTGS